MICYIKSTPSLFLRFDDLSQTLSAKREYYYDLKLQLGRVFDKELEFLIEISKMAQGDITNTVRIPDAQRKVEGINEDSIPKIVEALKQKCYISKGGNGDEITVTRKGFYHAIEGSGNPPSQFGMISYQEVHRVCPDVLEYIHKKTKNGPKIFITLQEITAAKWGAYGPVAISQIIEMLDDMRFVTYGQDKQEVRITPRGRYEVLRRRLS